MKPSFLRFYGSIITMILVCISFHAKGQYLFTVNELIEMAETRDHQSFDKLMKSKKFAFHKRETDKEGQVSFTYLDKNPTSSELIGKVVLMTIKGLASNGISLNTSANTFQFHMEQQAKQEGFTLSKTEQNGDRRFIKIIGQKEWEFTIRAPKKDTRATLQMATIYAVPYEGTAIPEPVKNDNSISRDGKSAMIESERRKSDLSKQNNENKLPINCTERLGAKTSEALGILLLKCIQTNDKETWMRCMHPDDRVETDEISDRKFAQHREKLAADGITNWSSVQFSRLTYPLRPMGGEKVDPTKTVPFATIEITYKNTEFIGQIDIGTFIFCEGRWLVWFSGYPDDDRIIRNFGK